MFGFLIVLLAAVSFCFQNVTVRVLFTEHPILGLFHTGGFVTPTLHHSLLLLWMRTMVVVPLMAVLAPTLHPPVWKELGTLYQPERRVLLGQVMAAGGLMFLYLALLYISIGLIPTGIALTLFFTYPVFTALFSWQWFGDRPSQLRWVVMGLVFLGSLLTMPKVEGGLSQASWMGIITGIASGVAYALHTVLAQKCFEKLHPVPFTWFSFTATLFLSGASLLLWPVEDPTISWLPLWIGGSLSAIFTFVGHVMNNIGIRQIGATAAAMIGSTNPVLTVVLAWALLQETLGIVQIVGVAIVTFSVALLAQEHRRASD